jgi:WG containing repeat
MILGPAGGQWAFIGKDGKNRIVLPAHTERAGDCVEGLAAIQVGNSCGYVDKSGGALVIASKFSSCDDFSEGLAVVYSGGKWQFIDKKAQVILNVPYEQVRAFRDGLASVAEGASGLGQKFGYIDKHGGQIWKPQPAL